LKGLKGGHRFESRFGLAVRSRLKVDSSIND